MKKVFCDLGSYNGDTVKEFYNWGQMLGDTKTYEIYAFEPNPDLTHQNIINAKKNGYTFKPWAASTYDGKIEMAIDKTETPLGSTIMSSKVSIWDNYPHVQVKCFNFSQWLKKFVDYDDVIVKMDIEGAEFPVLKQMIEEDTITIATHLLVEFHPNKVRDYNTTDKINLIKAISSRGVSLVLWH